MEKRPGDDEIAKIESVPPPDDDAYAAPTRVGEAAYRMLAEGMAAFDPPPPSRPADAPIPPRAPSKQPGPPLPDDGTLPRPHDDIDVEAAELMGTKLMPQPHLVAPPRPPDAPVFHPVPTPPELPPVAPPLMGPPQPPSVGTGASVRFGGIRPEIVIGVVSFLAVAVPAIVYLLLLR